MFHKSETRVSYSQRVHILHPVKIASHHGVFSVTKDQPVCT